jgi:hypothetical protein
MRVSPGGSGDRRRIACRTGGPENTGVGTFPDRGGVADGRDVADDRGREDRQYGGGENRGRCIRSGRGGRGMGGIGRRGCLASSRSSASRGSFETVEPGGELRLLV